LDCRGTEARPKILHLHPDCVEIPVQDDSKVRVLRRKQPIADFGTPPSP